MTWLINLLLKINEKRYNEYHAGQDAAMLAADYPFLKDMPGYVR